RVVHEGELDTERGRPLEQLTRAGDAARDGRDVARTHHLEALRGELGEPLDLEQLVRIGDDLVPCRHRPSARAGPGGTPNRPTRGTGTLSRLGVWRSLVARSVRVGEVP